MLELGAGDMVKLLHSVQVTLVHVLGHAGSMLVSLCHQHEALCRTSRATGSS